MAEKVTITDSLFEEPTEIDEQGTYIPKNQELVFCVEPFIYKINYVETDKLLSIEAEHTEELLVWSRILDKEIVSYESEKKQIGLQLPPGIINKIFSDFVSKSLDKNVIINFPQKIKMDSNTVTAILIEIKVTVPYKGTESLIIILEPKPINPETRINKKIALVKNENKEKYQEILKKIESDIKLVTTQIDKLNNRIAELEAIKEPFHKVCEYCTALGEEQKKQKESIAGFQKQFESDLSETDNTIGTVNGNLTNELNKVKSELNNAKNELNKKIVDEIGKVINLPKPA